MSSIRMLFLAHGLMLGCSLLGVFLFIKGWDRGSVVSFDKAVVVRQFVTQLSLQKMDSEKNRTLSDKFAKALKESIDEYARDNKAIVIKKEMVLASNKDVTALIAACLSKKMRGQS
jgi:hypothetical protein